MLNKPADHGHDCLFLKTKTLISLLLGRTKEIREHSHLWSWNHKIWHFENNIYPSKGGQGSKPSQFLCNTFAGKIRIICWILLWIFTTSPMPFNYLCPDALLSLCFYLGIRLFGHNREEKVNAISSQKLFTPEEFSLRSPLSTRQESTAQGPLQVASWARGPEKNG